MNLQINDAQMKGLVQEALLRSLDENTRNALLQGAIASLMQSVGNNYHSVPKIREMYETAVYDVARRIVTDQLNNDLAFATKMHDLVSKAFDKVFTEKSEELSSNFAEAISKAFKVRDC